MERNISKEDHESDVGENSSGMLDLPRNDSRNDPRKASIIDDKVQLGMDLLYYSAAKPKVEPDEQKKETKVYAASWLEQEKLVKAGKQTCSVVNENNANGLAKGKVDKNLI